MGFDPEDYGAIPGSECPYCGSYDFWEGDLLDVIYGYEDLEYVPCICECTECKHKFVIYHEYENTHVGDYSAPYEDAIGVPL